MPHTPLHSAASSALAMPWCTAAGELHTQLGPACAQLPQQPQAGLVMRFLDSCVTSAMLFMRRGPHQPLLKRHLLLAPAHKSHCWFLAQQSWDDVQGLDTHHSHSWTVVHCRCRLLMSTWLRWSCCTRGMAPSLIPTLSSACGQTCWSTISCEGGCAWHILQEPLHRVEKKPECTCWCGALLQALAQVSISSRSSISSLQAPTSI